MDTSVASTVPGSRHLGVLVSLRTEKLLRRKRESFDHSGWGSGSQCRLAIQVVGAFRQHHQSTQDVRGSPPATSVLKSAFVDKTLTGSNTESATSAVRSVMVTFRWPGVMEAADVYVGGSFSDWKPLRLRRRGQDDFIRSVGVPPGIHQFKFLVDDKWRTSPRYPIARSSMRSVNNQLLCEPVTVFKWDCGLGGDEVYVTGSFCDWMELLPLQWDEESGSFVLHCFLEPGTHNYQFLVDGQWRTLPGEEVIEDAKGHMCNMVVVEHPPAFHIFYSTGWEKPLLRVRGTDKNGQPLTEEWKEMLMSDTQSRARPDGGSWWVGVVPAGGLLGQNSKLEFVVSDGQAHEDRRLNGTNYVCPVIGGYKLQRGELKPFPRACQGPIMLVSDLDGTMVDSGNTYADQVMREFCTYWENVASLCGSKLVYNTGRSLGQFISLLEEKQGALAMPDVVITAVGTKIFHLDSAGGGRVAANGSEWCEDMSYKSQLDKSWDLSAVKMVAGEIFRRYGTDNAVHWLDDGSEHPHRIALNVRVEVVEDLTRELQHRLTENGCQVQTICSGTHGWRYVDCVPKNGGKLKALEHVRRLYGIPRERCVAVGDSCNDILMLEGENPAIIVGNAQEELREWLLNQPQADRVIYTEAPFAKGILEGLSRHGLY